MTDYSELIKRLRICERFDQDQKDAADALEAQAKEIAEKDARIAELEAALKEAATRLKEVHSKGRASRAQYKIYADEAYAALKGEK